MTTRFLSSLDKSIKSRHRCKIRPISVSIIYNSLGEDEDYNRALIREYVSDLFDFYWDEYDSLDPEMVVGKSVPDSFPGWSLPVVEEVYRRDLSPAKVIAKYGINIYNWGAYRGYKKPPLKNMIYILRIYGVDKDKAKNIIEQVIWRFYHDVYNKGQYDASLHESNSSKV